MSGNASFSPDCLLFLGQKLDHAGIKGLGKRSKEKLAAKDIHTVRDLLLALPRTYHDFSVITAIGKLRPDQWVHVQGRVLSMEKGKTKQRGVEVHRAVVEDETGRVMALWYGKRNLGQALIPGVRCAFFGQTAWFNQQLVLQSPDIQFPEKGQLSEGTITPIYREIGQISSSWWRKWMAQILSLLPFEDYLDERQRMGLPSLREAWQTIHFPQTMTQVRDLENRESAAFQRLLLEEALVLHFQMDELHQRLKKQTKPPLLLSKKDSWEEYYGLPFSLTDDQRSVLLAITSVLQSGERLAGLLMGDVGSGKTLVALLLAMAFLEKGQQVAFLCPTQLLAQQHFQTACTLFPNSRQAIALMTAQTPKGEQETLRQQLLQGESPTLVIGTHRLFQKDLVFASLSLVIIDEQHRFGVAQRKQMVHKGTQPHVLSMTATPIPRSMAMYRYGEFQVFQLKEKPKGRQSIHTVLKKESNREQLYPFLRNRLKQGERLYWVFPFIEGEEADWTKSAVNMHEYLSKAFPEVPVGLIHGQLDALEQERIMNEFKSGSIAILITTTIIEVGVDVTEATVMVIEHANRFGVSQLHQLRGRVGRGQKKSYCFVLLPDQITQETEKKFRLFEQCQDGFVLAEFDLSQRGLGELGGVKQSGNDRFRWLDLWRDRQFLASTAAHYQALVQPNPQVMVSVSMLKQQLLPREEAGLLS